MILQGKFELGGKSPSTTTKLCLETSEKYGYLIVASDNVIEILSVPALESKFDSGDSFQSLCNDLAPLVLSLDEKVICISLSCSERFLAVFMQSRLLLMDFHGILMDKRYESTKHCIQYFEFPCKSLAYDPVLSWYPYSQSQQANNSCSSSNDGSDDLLLVSGNNGELCLVSGTAGFVNRISDTKYTSFSWSPPTSATSSRETQRQTQLIGAAATCNRIDILDIRSGRVIYTVDDVLETGDGNVCCEITHLHWFRPDAVFVGGRTRSTDGDNDDAPELLVGIVRLSLNIGDTATVSNVEKNVITDTICPPERSDVDIVLSSRYIEQW